MTMPAAAPLSDVRPGAGYAEFVDGDVHVGADAMHDGAESWARAFRRAGLERGDRIVCALPNGVAFAQILLAAMGEGLTLVPVPPSEPVDMLMTQVDARLAITPVVGTAATLAPTRTGAAPAELPTPRAAGDRHDDLAFLLRSSGTTRAPRWIAISRAGVHAVLESHLPRLSLQDATVLGALPWHHAFGLVLGLLPSLLRARRIVTAHALRLAPMITGVATRTGVTHMSMVPLTAMRLASDRDGLALLRALDGGVVGGAAIDASLAAALQHTRLRVGYGQTEASPGIMLGEPGEFRARYLGRPLGCAVRIEADGVLSFRGPNACAGIWERGALAPLPADRWHRTGDIVVRSDDGYSFVGRASATFKLANGRVVDAPALERALEEAFPALTDVVLSSEDDRSVDIRYATRDGAPIARASLVAAVGAIGALVGRVRHVDATEWQRTAKGEIDRHKLPALP